MPIYSCKVAGDEKARIVKAKSAAQARAHLVQAEPINAEELADALDGGGVIETAIVVETE